MRLQNALQYYPALAPFWITSVHPGLQAQSMGT
jgi:hypothetical protein